MKKLLAILLTAALFCGAAFALAGHSVTSAEKAGGNVRFEGYVAGDGAGNSIGDWVGFWDTDPTDTTEYNFFTGTLGAAYYDGSIYGYLYGYDSVGTLYDSFYVMDAETHFINYPEGASSGGEMVYGMAYNYADGQMYAMVDENRTYLATVDLETGALTKTVDIDLGSYLGLQTFAIDYAGNFYALTFSALSARLVKIDPATGALTELFATGLPTYYAQSMTWDEQTHALYWAQVDSATSSSNGLYKIDVSAHTVTKLGVIGTNFEITCLMVIPDYEEPVTTPEPTATPEPTVAPTETPEPTAAPTEAPAGLLGDVDCDGEVTFSDISMLAQYLSGSASLTPQGELNADMDMSGELTFADVGSIYQFLIG